MITIADLETTIKKIIMDEILKSPKLNYFREPIVGFASADNPLYQKLDTMIGHHQVHPREFLDTAQTVIVYFIPFSKEVVESIQGSQTISKIWSEAYKFANETLSCIGKELEHQLTRMGIVVRCEPPTYTKATYDSVNLTAKWSHKSQAVVAGIGTFGLNHLLITKSGTAGRLGSVVIDAKIEPTKIPDSSYCLYYKTGKCKICISKCPTGALSEDGSFDRFRCNAYLDGKNIHDMEQGCGMCSSGPCAMKGF